MRSDVGTEAEMQALGRRLGERLEAGDLVVLVGPLGAGKTVLARGIATGLGVRSPVTSPTFVIARVHRDGRVPFVHVDAYRLGDRVEVDDLDLDAEAADSVTVVEWGGGLVEQLAESRLEVRIDRSDDNEDMRRVEITGHGARWAATDLESALAGQR